MNCGSLTYTSDWVAADQHPWAVRRLTADLAVVSASAIPEICPQAWGEGPTESVLGSIHSKINGWKGKTIASCVIVTQC